MRFLFRWAFRLFLVIVVLTVALVLLKDSLLKSYVENRIRAETGMDVKIGRLETGLFSPTLTVEDLKLYNTAEFGGSPLVDVPELHAECDPGALAWQKLRFKLLRLDLQQLNIVENRQGRTNINPWMGGLQKLASTNVHEKIAGNFEFAGIDTLNLTLGKVTRSSLKRPGQVQEIDLGLKNQIFTNVRNFDDLYALLIKVLFQKGISISSLNSAPPKATTANGPVRRVESETPQGAHLQSHR